HRRQISFIPAKAGTRRRASSGRPQDAPAVVPYENGIARREMDPGLRRDDTKERSCNLRSREPHSRSPLLSRTSLMEMTGERRIPAPRQLVWERLNDPETLKQCIPGCETIEKVSDTEFTAKVTAKVGPVKASFSGKVTLTDLDPPAGYT